MAFCTCADGIMCIPDEEAEAMEGLASDAAGVGLPQHSLETAAASRVRMVWRGGSLCAP